MAHIRPLALLGLFALLITACSRTTEIRTETLTPQFGGTTAGADYADHVAANPDAVYLGGYWNSKPALIKFTRLGRIPWIRTLPKEASVKEVAAGPGGAAYIIYSLDDAEGTRSFFARKYEQTGAVVWSRQFASGIERGFVNASAEADKNGNLYFFTSFGNIEAAQGELRKYKPDGTLVWRKRTTGYIYDLDVSANGFVHTVSLEGADSQVLTRYKPDGGFVWRIPVPYAYEKQEVAVGREFEIYVASNNELYPHDWYTTLTKYNSRGEKVWQRSVQDGIGLRFDGLDADAQGTVFLGLTEPDFGSEQAYRSKAFYTYSSGGKRLIHRVFDFGTEHPIVGPVAVSADEVYLALAGVGDSGQDGLLVRLNGLTGEVTWTR